ncbi:MAG TPA: ribosomal protein S5-alanine N-acetyltransferase [Burkholderiaceae bacterium]
MKLPQIQAERCILAVLEPSQAPLALAFYERNRAHLAPWEPVREPRFYTLDDTAARLQSSARAYEAGQAVHFAILAPDGGEMLGTCNFSNIVRGAFQACHLGYSVAAHREGQGLMREALAAGIAHMFDTVGLHRIMANYIPDNQRSAALLQRLGFEREGYARDYLFIAGRWQDHVLMALTNRDWRAQ